MTKYMRSRHVPLNEEGQEAVKERFDDFTSEIQEAGEMLKIFREDKGWSQDELADEVGLTAEHIDQMETGKQPISVDQAKVFGKLFDVDYHLFL